jgi:hypothetical protein
MADLNGLIFYSKKHVIFIFPIKSSRFEAPYCCDDDEAKIPPEWLLVEKAALIFEEDNRVEIEKTMIKRLEPIGKLNFKSFRMVFLFNLLWIKAMNYMGT